MKMERVEFNLDEGTLMSLDRIRGLVPRGALIRNIVEGYVRSVEDAIAYEDGDL